LALAIGGFSVVVEINYVEPSGSPAVATGALIFEAYSDPDYNTDMILASANEPNTTYVYDYVNPQLMGADTPDGINKVGGTLSITANAVAGQSGTPTAPDAINGINFSVNGLPDGACFIRSIKIYPVKTAVELAVLTA
jgi:hypothetical protein